MRHDEDFSDMDEADISKPVTCTLCSFRTTTVSGVKVHIARKHRFAESANVLTPVPTNNERLQPPSSTPEFNDFRFMPGSSFGAFPRSYQPSFQPSFSFSDPSRENLQDKVADDSRRQKLTIWNPAFPERTVEPNVQSSFQTSSRYDSQDFNFNNSFPRQMAPTTSEEPALDLSTTHDLKIKKRRYRKTASMQIDRNPRGLEEHKPGSLWMNQGNPGEMLSGSFRPFPEQQINFTGNAQFPSFDGDTLWPGSLLSENISRESNVRAQKENEMDNLQFRSDSNESSVNPAAVLDMPTLEKILKSMETQPDVSKQLLEAEENIPSIDERRIVDDADVAAGTSSLNLESGDPSPIVEENQLSPIVKDDQCRDSSSHELSDGLTCDENTIPPEDPGCDTATASSPLASPSKLAELPKLCSLYPELVAEMPNFVDGFSLQPKNVLSFMVALGSCLVRNDNQQYQLMRLYCSHCTRTFLGVNLLREHLGRVTGYLPFRCKRCNFSTAVRNHAYEHHQSCQRQIHIETRPEIDKNI